MGESDGGRNPTGPASATGHRKPRRAGANKAGANSAGPASVPAYDKALGLGPQVYQNFLRGVEEEYWKPRQIDPTKLAIRWSRRLKAKGYVKSKEIKALRIAEAIRITGVTISSFNELSADQLDALERCLNVEG